MASYLLPRSFPYNAARFRFAFRLHLIAIIGLALVALLIARFSPRLLVLAYMFLVAMVIVIALTLANAMWPVRTTHSVDGDSVILRQGLSFKLAIPLSRISKAKRVEVGTGRAGIHLDRGSGILEVIAAGPEAVRLRLNDPVVHRGTLVREVVVDVLEPGEFINCIRERKKGAALIERMDGGRAERQTAGDEALGDEEDAPETPGPKEEPPAAPPPVRPPKASARPVRQREPDEPKETAEDEEAPARRDGEDEIEVVPALPSTSDTPARVVRIPRRKQ